MARFQEQHTFRLEKQILGFCRRIADSRSIKGICICKDHLLFPSKDLKTILEVLIVIEGFKPKLMNYVKFFNGKPTVFYAVDGWVFEKDVEAGFLGEAFSIHLAFPYMPLKGSNYLKRCEIKLKKRLILELLENLVLDFPELSYVIHIKPEYFMYEALLSRARLFPPIYYDICSFLRREVQKQNLKKVMEGYNDALRELEREGIVKRVDLDLFKISKEFIEESRKRKALFTNLLRSAQKALFNSLLGTFPKVLRVLSERVDAILKFQFSENEWLKFRAEHTIKNPEAYLLVPTANGLIPLSATINIEDFANKIMKAGEKASVATEKLGGVLNDVYLVKVFGNDEERKVVVKSFKDWSSFKWFPLTLWTVGTRAFAVLGRSRLERECSINQFLHSKGFAVPKLLSVSHSQKLVFLEYLEGETLDKVIKKIYSLGAEGEIQKELEIIRKVGEIIAKVHALNVALGDTKPENVLVGKNGEIFLMDFEQASRNGDKTWDVAEILYYLGHYAPPFTETRLIEIAAQAFIKGYLEAGGNLKTVKAAGKPKYTKVFSVFVFPHIILAISNICQNAESIKG